MPWDNTRDVPALWIMLSSDSHDKTLTHNEVDTIKRVRSMPLELVEHELEKFMAKDMKYFDDVDAQIESLQIFWSRVIQEKRNRDKEVHSRGKKNWIGINVKNYLVGLMIIPQRLNIGLGHKHTRHASLDRVSSDNDLAKMARKIEDKLKSATSTSFSPTEESRPQGQNKELKNTEDSASSSEESAIPKKVTRRGGRNEPERERTTKRSTRAGKSFRHASKGSATRRARQNAKESDSESATMDDSASSSEDLTVSRKGKHLGGKLHSQVKIDDDFLRRKNEIRNIMEKELISRPVDDPDWGRRLPKLFKESYLRLKHTNKSESAASDSSSDPDTTGLLRLDSSDSEEVTTLSNKRTRGGWKNTKASTGQRKVRTRKQDSTSSEESISEESAAEKAAAEESAAEGSTMSKKRKPIEKWLARPSAKRRVGKSTKDSSSGEESESATVKDSTSDESVTEQGVAPRQGSEEL